MFIDFLSSVHYDPIQARNLRFVELKFSCFSLGHARDVKVFTCFADGWNGESLSEVSDPQDEDSESSVVNFLPTLGDAGGRLLQTCD